MKLNLKDEKVKQLVGSIHEELMNRIDGVAINGDSITEGKILSILAKDPSLEPKKVGNAMRDRYGEWMMGDEVIPVLRKMKLNIFSERNEIFKWAKDVATAFVGSIGGNTESYDKFRNLRDNPPQRDGSRIKNLERIAVITLYECFPELDMYNDIDDVYLLGNTLSMYFFYSITDILCVTYNFPLYKKRSRRKRKGKEGKEAVKEKAPVALTYEQLSKQYEVLKESLEMSDMLLNDLRDEFEEQLEESKVKELTDFFTRLNSEKYGCILDVLLSVRMGMNELQKKDVSIPLELNGIMIMVKKLIQFVRDCHIEPIMRLDSIIEVTAADIESFNYEGSAFTSPSETKVVRVVSPGWIYKDREVQISRPKLKEEN